MIEKPSLVALMRARDLAKSGAGRAARIGAGLSIREMSRAVGASPAAIYRWEKGERLPRSDAGIRWAREVMKLLSRSEDEEGP